MAQSYDPDFSAPIAEKSGKKAHSLPQAHQSAWGRVSTRRWAGTALIYLLLIVGGIIFALPFLWMISSSLKTQVEVFLFPPRPLPAVMHWENYPEALTAAPFGRYFLNSVVISALVVIGAVISSSMIGYGFARIRGWGRDPLFAIVLATLMLPSQVTMIPTFLIFRELN